MPCGTLCNYCLWLLWAILESNWWVMEWNMLCTRCKRKLSCECMREACKRESRRDGWLCGLHLLSCLTVWPALHSSTAELSVSVLSIDWPIWPQALRQPHRGAGRVTGAGRHQTHLQHCGQIGVQQSTMRSPAALERVRENDRAPKYMKIVIFGVMGCLSDWSSKFKTSGLYEIGKNTSNFINNQWYSNT